MSEPNDEDWEPFKAFASLPNLRWDEPNLRFVDLNGDGHADVLITEQRSLHLAPFAGGGRFWPGPARPPSRGRGKRPTADVG